MGTLHEMFPASPELIIYLPLGTSPDDNFEAILITDNSLSRGTIYKGDVVVFQHGLIRPTGLHAVLTPTGKNVGFVVEKGDDLISLEFNDDEYEPETYRRDEIEILGRVVQVYLGGDIRERWELIREPRPAARKRKAK